MAIVCRFDTRWVPLQDGDRILGKIKINQELEVTKENGVWLQVQMPGADTPGWVHKRYIRPLRWQH